MRIVVTGATGLIGSRLVGALRERGDDVTVLSRDPSRAGAALRVDAIMWDPAAGPPPVSALRGAGAVVHLAGENVAQRWTARARRTIRDSREAGTRNLVTALREAGDDAPPVLISASAVGYYGPRGDERIDETAPPGGDFLAQVCVAWEREAEAAAALGMRVVTVRTGVVLDRDGGALGRMLLPFRLGIGGPVAGGRQYMPWIAAEDLVSLYVAAVSDDAWRGPVNASAPEPVTNAEFSRALGRVLHRPAVAPIPGLALRALYGEMAEIVTTGQRAVPARALEAGFGFAFPQLEGALEAALREQHH
jgi:uncharacterized protein (TIGR01777 family)